jgi:hypothetical protein
MTTKYYKISRVAFGFWLYKDAAGSSPPQGNCFFARQWGALSIFPPYRWQYRLLLGGIHPVFDSKALGGHSQVKSIQLMYTMLPLSRVQKADRSCPWRPSSYE